MTDKPDIFDAMRALRDFRGRYGEYALIDAASGLSTDHLDAILERMRPVPILDVSQFREVFRPSDDGQPSEFIAEKPGIALPLKGLRVFINGRQVIVPTPYTPGDRVHTEIFPGA